MTMDDVNVHTLKQLETSSTHASMACGSRSTYRCCRWGQQQRTRPPFALSHAGAHEGRELIAAGRPGRHQHQ